MLDFNFTSLNCFQFKFFILSFNTYSQPILSCIQSYVLLDQSKHFNMKVTINSLNRALEKQKKTAFALHITNDHISNNKENFSLANQLKFKFDTFEQDKNQLTLSQRRNMKQFKLLKQKCKISTTKKINQDITHHIPGKLLYAQSFTNHTKNHNNPELLYEDQLASSINQLNMCKVVSSTHSTKANSRQKSRASSIESSVNCCKVVKADNEDLYIKIVDRQPAQHPVIFKSKKKQQKISKIVSPEIKNTTRIIMLDWLFQLAAEIELPKQAVYNAVDYVDKYVASSVVTKQNYQKLGLACLFLATKLEMSSHPQIHTFLQAMDNQVDKAMLIETERKIVNTLKFRLNPPTLFQYMTLVLFTLKTFKAEYKNIGWLNDLPVVERDDFLWKKVFWILDGVTMEGVMVHKYLKSDICLAILYTAIMASFEGRLIQQSREQSVYCDKRRLESTVNSEIQFTHYETYQERQEKDKKIRLSYQCFFRYATISNRALQDLGDCMDDLKKWKDKKCNCDDNLSFGYHEELKYIALEK